MFLRTFFGILILSIAICYAEQSSANNIAAGREICNASQCVLNLVPRFAPKSIVLNEPRVQKAAKSASGRLVMDVAPILLVHYVVGTPICVDWEHAPPPPKPLRRRGLNYDKAHNSNERVNGNNMKASPIKRAVSAADFCPEFVLPCPNECPDTCIRPAGVPCPLTHPGWCPTWCSGHYNMPDFTGSVDSK
ncbi:hypothetical protein INT43_003147 [Umbelopsis isabellina]|uniref:Secreted protein n=1 Tax=Mortierella isabellina TaxID=91625 RepID=A0A8H7PQE9_MORIS|nr:hypothetical protein INT43_003147 [Umbelopsis isabellina]